MTEGWGSRQHDMDRRMTDCSVHCQRGPCCLSVALAALSCPTLCDPMDYSPPGFSVPGTSQARILGWVTISFSIIRIKLCFIQFLNFYLVSFILFLSSIQDITLTLVAMSLEACVGCEFVVSIFKKSDHIFMQKWILYIASSSSEVEILKPSI